MAWSISLKAAVAVALLLIAPNAWACAVCGFGDDPTKNWYLLSTMLLSLIPLAAMGGVIYFIYRRVRQAPPSQLP